MSGTINGELVGHDTLVQLDCLVYLNEVSSLHGASIGEAIDLLLSEDKTNWGTVLVLDRSKDEKTGKYPNGLYRHQWLELLWSMRQDEELCKLKIVDGTRSQTKSERSMLLKNPDTGEHIVAFRGTVKKDEWVDNQEGFYQYDTADQREALEFVEQMVDDHGVSNLTITGHSKGGNKAMYVTIKAEYGIIGRCVAVNSQGFSDEFVNDFYTKNDIKIRKNKITNICAQGDYVSPLLNRVAGNVIFVKTGKLDSAVDYHYSSYLLTPDKEGREHVGLKLVPRTNEGCAIHEFINDITLFAMEELDLKERESILTGMFGLMDVLDDKVFYKKPTYIGRVLKIIGSDYQGIDEDQFDKYVSSGKWDAEEAAAARSIASFVILLQKFVNENPGFTEDMEDDLLDQIGDLYGFGTKTVFKTLMKWLDDNPFVPNPSPVYDPYDIYDIDNAHDGFDYNEFHGYSSYRNKSLNNKSNTLDDVNKGVISNNTVVNTGKAVNMIDYINKTVINNNSGNLNKTAIGAVAIASSARTITGFNPYPIKSIAEFNTKLPLYIGRYPRIRTNLASLDNWPMVTVTSVESTSSAVISPVFDFKSLYFRRVKKTSYGGFGSGRKDANIKKLEELIRNIDRSNDAMDSIVNELLKNLRSLTRDVSRQYRETYVRQDIARIESKIRVVDKFRRELADRKNNKVRALKGAIKTYQITEQQIIRNYC